MSSTARSLFGSNEVFQSVFLYCNKNFSKKKKKKNRYIFANYLENYIVRILIISLNEKESFAW